MMLNPFHFFSHCFVVVCACCILSACGGGGSGGGGGASGEQGTVATDTNPTTQTTTQAQTQTTGDASLTAALSPAGRVAQVMNSGDSRQLKPEDAAYLLTTAQGTLSQALATQNQLLSAFYAQGASTKFGLVQESYMIQPSARTLDKVFPLVVGDKGNVLASVSTVEGDRIAGYGYDILAGFSPNSKQQTTYSVSQSAHQPVFKRVLAWLVSGDAGLDLTLASATPVKVAWGSLPTSSTVMYTQGNVKTYEPLAAAGLRALGVKFTSVSCDPLSAPVSDCAATSQLVVIGASDQSDAGKLLLQTQLVRLKEIIAAKIPVLYLNAHPSPSYWNDYARAAFVEDFARLAAMGFAWGDTPDKRNYYKLDADANDISVEQIQRNSNKWGSLVDSLATGKFTDYVWDSTCTSLSCAPPDFVKDIDTVTQYLKGSLDNMALNQDKLFDGSANFSTLKALVLWADLYRRTIQYPLNKSGDQAAFQQAYIADSLVAYLRDAGVEQGAVGNFLSAQTTTHISADPDTITVSLPGSIGFTAIGRFALPGVPITIKLASLPKTGRFTFFINTMSPASTKVWEAPTDMRSGYRRPQYLRSPAMSLSTNELTVVSPYGGTLELGFDGASDAVVTVQIKGAVSQAFYDTTQGTPDASAFFSQVTSSSLGWLEIKTPGLEIHSLISNAMDFLQPSDAQLADTKNVFPSVAKPYYSRASGIDMGTYLNEAKRYVMEDAYQLAGFRVRGLELTPSVQTFCNSHGWDCTSPSIHAPPTVQHFLSDVRASCGSMCSGNPITSGSAFEPRGWGESHEMGHNLQAFKVYDGISSEVSNNIFPLHKKWRLFRELGRLGVGYYNELNDTQAVFDLLSAAYKNSNLTSAADKLTKVKQSLWADTSYAAQNRARLYFYLQWVLIYHDVVKERNPQLSDAQAWDQAWEVYTLLYLHLRQLNAASSATWSSTKAGLGFGQYSAPPITSSGVNSAGNYPMHDILLVGLSLITGRDQRPLFDFWGITTTDAARNQVAALKDSSGSPLVAQPIKFYAVVCSDDFRSYAAIDMNAVSPSLPAAWGTSPFTSQTSNASACDQVTNSYLAKQ